jgi:tetratricopeptide (TPR) repeat protein
MSDRLPLIVIFLLIFSFGFAQNKPKKDYVLYEEAESAHNDGDLAKAQALLDECVKSNPYYYEAYALRGSVREQLKDFDGALVDYSIYLENRPANLEVLMSRAVLRYKIGFYDQAKEDFLKLVTLPYGGETNTLIYRQSASVGDKNPIMTTNSGYHQSHIFNYLGLTEGKLKNLEGAKHYFDSAIRLEAHEPDYFVNRGLVREALGDSTAYLDYERALRLNANHTLAKHNLDAFFQKQKQKLSIEERLSKTIEADSSMLYPYLERAQQRYESKFYEGAHDDYSMALHIDSTNVEIWLARGLTREKLKNFKGAFSDYTKAIDLKEDYSKAWLNRGNVLTKLERYDDAIEDYTVAILYRPDYEIAYYNRAMAKAKLKKNGEACTDLTQAEKLGMKVDGKVKSKICSK